ncbi:membrane protein insertase YidC [Virgibacillus oceani]|uniref:Membrane protein insertase YidC n=1 Tax=Virgibacillus oceani TaxID=1479511 RepID=A0A917M9J8_9BACI|nr:membrane protein insertase YidC [Virgibacillus oceani]GGG83731.1 membrane protein insertase YidC 1 [Virgibacillus oceani]
MQNRTVFTFFKKYSFTGIILIIFLTGCSGASNNPITEDSPGWFDHYFVLTFSNFIKGLASFLGDDYGLSIIVITLFIRLAIMPFMLKQMKNSREMKEKMDIIKPEMNEIKEKYKDKTDADSKMKMQQEMTQLYQKHQLNPIASMGCLPMIIQFPILIAFYYAIRRTPEIASHNFLWFNLGSTDILLTIVAVVVYFLQFKATQLGMDPKQKKQTAFMGLISPIMIGIVSFNAPAALPLYWTVGGLFLIGQTLISRKLHPAK